MQQGTKDLQGWVTVLCNAEIPILRQTVRGLQNLRKEGDKASPYDIATIISRDPLMTAILLRYLQVNKRRSQTNVVLEIEQALLMLGMDTFFNKVVSKVSVEDMLRTNIPALVSTLQVVHRSHRASSYAFDWAVRLRDLHFEEIRIAALLYDMTEILMWCFAPAEMLRIKAMQEQDKSLRSGEAQQQVFGFALSALQKELVSKWELPTFLLHLIDNESSQQERVLNVVLACRLARHVSYGWDDAALPDDYRDIGALLNMQAEDVMGIVGAEIPE